MWSELLAKEYVGVYDGDLGAHHHQDDEHDKQESKKVVKRVLPYGDHEELEFYVKGTKW